MQIPDANTHRDMQKGPKCKDTLHICAQLLLTTRFLAVSSLSTLSSLFYSAILRIQTVYGHLSYFQLFKIKNASCLCSPCLARHGAPYGISTGTRLEIAIVDGRLDVIESKKPEKVS